MKSVYRSIIFMLGITVAAQYYWSTLNWSSRRRVQKKAKKVQRRAGDMWDTVMIATK